MSRKRGWHRFGLNVGALRSALERLDPGVLEARKRVKLLKIRLQWLGCSRDAVDSPPHQSPLSVGQRFLTMQILLGMKVIQKERQTGVWEGRNGPT